ncbi:hypothetical protein IM40_00905 [Candidatus Paracaedimonas acanthamoebae]|nr:hypothetical protein IM40_00905 [Candidatus Paracaedimonas acanthamoebae]
MQGKVEDITKEDRKDNPCKVMSAPSSKSWVYCAGETRFGHPRIFLDLSKTGVAICPYCSCQYIVKK